MKLWHNNVLMAPADEFGAGGGSGEEDVDIFADEDNEFGQGGEPNQQQGGGAGNLNPDVLSQAMANAMKQVMPQQQQQPEAPISEEEFAKLTKKFIPGEEVAKAFFGEGATPQQTEALKSLVNGIYQHLYAATGMVLKGELDGVRSQLTPLQQEIATQRENAFASDVIKSVPALKPYPQLVRGAMQQLRQSGWRPSGVTQQDQVLETKKTIARMVEAHVKQFQPEFSLRSNAAVGAGGRGGMPRMAGMSGGGSSGGAGNGGGKTPNWQKVLGA